VVPFFSSFFSFFYSRHFTPSSALLADLPYHIVVGMPALSPTMETGVLAEWYLPEGSAFSAGAVLAKIETDKASIDFEAQDDGVIAKILVEAGSADIPCGTPIMVTVEELEDAAAFADFKVVVEETAAAAATPEPEAPKVAAAAVAPPPPPVAAAPAAVAPPLPVVAAPVAAMIPPPPTMEALVAAVAPVMSTGWGEFAKINSPIAKTLSKQQQDYVDKYGTTGQVPL
jgi:pyruvate dehydrogenase E2 component (dihydrolipoamide acetyltransferase)